MESDPRWLCAAPATGPMFGHRAECVQRPSAGISHWAYSKSHLKCLPPLAMTSGIKQPSERSSLGTEGLYIGELNKHHYDPHVVCLPGIKVTSTLLCVCFSAGSLGLQIKELQVRSWLHNQEL